MIVLVSLAPIIVVAVLAAFAIALLASSVRVLREYQRGVVFRLGRLLGAPKGPGPLPAHPDHRPDGAGGAAHDHAGRPAAGGHHPRQRPGAR